MPPLRFICFSVCLAAALAPWAGCKKTHDRNVAAVVNGYKITYDELDKYYRSQTQGSAEKPDEEQVTLMKLNLLRELIDNQIMLQRAERLGLMAVDSDVDAKLTELKAPYTQEEFEKQLKSRGMTMDEMRNELRRTLSIQKLFNKEITSKISISDAEVRTSYEANKANFNLPEPQVHLAQILVTPIPDPQVHNLRNDKANNEEEARKKIQMLESRLKNSEDFVTLAQNYSEDPNSAPNGGDLGFVPQSALEKADAELRRVVALLRPGEISAVVHTPQAYRILKLYSREPAGQREFSDPRVQQTIRETLLNRKDQLLKAAYYEVARNEAQVVNYLAQDIVAEAGKSRK
ncbi:MAG TPA: peptidylprolyl isomerase [Bryobacterales bacterium]|nr:peptidylprolyl isomerase [Bryobacterales bacterium]